LRFVLGSLSDRYRSETEAARETIRRAPGEYIVGVNEDEYIDYLMEKHAFKEIELADQLPQVARTSRVLDVRGINGRSVPSRVPFMVVVFAVLPNPNLGRILNYRPSNCPVALPELEVCEEGLRIEERFPNNGENAEVLIKSIQDQVNRWVGYWNKDIGAENDKMREALRSLFHTTREQVETNIGTLDDLARRMPVEVIRDLASFVPGSTNAASGLVVTRKPPRVEIPEIPYLEETSFERVLEAVNSMCRFFERVPSTFSQLGEEDLRSVILASLNCWFKGRASGETFSRKGKTDIYLRLEGTDASVFVAECKYWDGPKTISDASSQLLGYMTWRDSYGVVIIFSKRKMFSNVLEKVPSAIQELDSYQDSFQEIEPGHYASKHSLPDDPKLRTTIHYILCNLVPPS